MKNSKLDLKNLTGEELTAFLAGLGKERFRSRQIMRWIYARGVTSFAEMTDLSKALREELEQIMASASRQDERRYAQRCRCPPAPAEANPA